MDENIPAVLICTPQRRFGPDGKAEPMKQLRFSSLAARFVKTTGFAIEQFEERIDDTLVLPDQLEDDDLLALVHVHFPDVDEDCIEYVVSAVGATERNYASDIAKISRRAKCYAQDNGRERPIFDDIEAAVHHVLPSKRPPVATESAGQALKSQAKPSRKEVRRNGSASSLQRVRKAAESVLQSGGKAPVTKDFSRGSAKPVMLTG